MLFTFSQKNQQDGVSCFSFHKKDVFLWNHIYDTGSVVFGFSFGFVSFHAFRELGTVKTSVYIYLVPVITVFTSALVLKERLTALMGIGAALTLAGLILSEQKAGKK